MQQFCHCLMNVEVTQQKQFLQSDVVGQQLNQTRLRKKVATSQLHLSNVSAYVFKLMIMYWGTKVSFWDL